jgi:hypothetical protein
MHIPLFGCDQDEVDNISTVTPQTPEITTSSKAIMDQMELGQF